MRVLLLGLALFCAAPAIACINDREVENTEREFRARYRDAEPEGQAGPGLVTAGIPIVGALLGAALLAGAIRQASRS